MSEVALKASKGCVRGGYVCVNKGLYGSLFGDVIRKEAWSFYRIISGVHLCWELEKPKRPQGGGTWRLYWC